MVDILLRIILVRHCEKCRENSCYSCTLRKYQEDLQSERDRRTSAEWRIERELEPRIKAEKCAYDRWVTEDTGVAACDSFSSLVDEMIDFVEDNDNYMDWDSRSGDLEEMILYLIHHKDDIEYFYILDKRDLR